MTDLQIIVTAVVVVIAAYVCYELYKAKKNDGKITMDEVIDIATGTAEIINDIVNDLKGIKDIGTGSKANEVIKEKILEYLKTSDKLTEWQRNLVNDNVDKLVDVTYNKIIKK